MPARRVDHLQHRGREKSNQFRSYRLSAGSGGVGSHLIEGVRRPGAHRVDQVARHLSRTADVQSQGAERRTADLAGNLFGLVEGGIRCQPDVEGDQDAPSTHGTGPRGDMGRWRPAVRS